MFLFGDGGGAEIPTTVDRREGGGGGVSVIVLAQIETRITLTLLLKRMTTN